MESTLWNVVGYSGTHLGENSYHRSGTGTIILAEIRITAVEPERSLLRIAVSYSLKITPNLRIYIVKFREQTTHAERTRNGEGMTNSSVTNNYSYFSDCTSYMYSATESNLKDKLNTIADDIKSCTGHQNAKNAD